MSDKLESLISRLEAVASQLEKTVKPKGGDAGGVDPSVTSYDEYVAQYVQPWLATARNIAPDVSDMVCVLKFFVTEFFSNFFWSRLPLLKKVSLN